MKLHHYLRLGEEHIVGALPLVHFD